MEGETYLADYLTVTSDAITKLKYGETSDNLLVSSWDSTCTLYDGYSNALKHRYEAKAAILAADFTPEEKGAYIGGLEQKVVKVDFETNETTELGHHDSPISCVEYDQHSKCLYTGSWDKSFKIWDERSSNKETVREVHDKVYALSTCRNKVVVGMANSKVVVYDTRSSKDLEYEEETGLGKYQIRCIQTMPSGIGFAAGSTEGRIAIEYFPDTKPEEASNFSYKCHRITKEDEDGSKTSFIYPVNDISFHPKFQTFASCGSDGLITTWDPDARKRLWKRQFDCGINSVSFNRDGSRLAVGICYNYDNEVEEPTTIPSPCICIIKINESHVKNKSKK